MTRRATPRPASETTEAPLPADRAFVVQLRAADTVNENLFVGRVEHIASGNAKRFDSVETLIAFITTVLTAAEPHCRERSLATSDRGKTE
jgi:hypothetical protein